MFRLNPRRTTGRGIKPTPAHTSSLPVRSRGSLAKNGSDGTGVDVAAGACAAASFADAAGATVGVETGAAATLPLRDVRFADGLEAANADIAKLALAAQRAQTVLLDFRCVLRARLRPDSHERDFAGELETCRHARWSFDR